MNNWYARQITSADELAQAFTDRHAERLTGFIRDIIIATAAKRMGPGGYAIANEHAPGWSKQTIGRLAALSAMPENLITNPETPLGVFWLILQNVKPPESFDIMQKAQDEGWTIPKAKKKLDIETVRESRLAKMEAELDGLRKERQKIEGLISEVHSFGGDLVKGIRTLLARLRRAEGNG